MSIPFRLSFSYGAYFFYGGISMPWWPVWLEGRGLDEVQIAELLAFERWIIVVASLVLAQLSDRTGHRRTILVLFSVGVLAAYALFGLVSEYWQYFAVAFLVAIFRSPLIPLSDSITMAHVRREDADYGRVRLWGSISFLVGSFAGGVILEGRSTDLVLWSVVASCALFVVGFCLLPDTRGEGRAVRLTSGLRLATRPVFLMFMLTVGLLMVSHTAVYAFGSLYWRSQGIPETWIGYLWACGVITEIVLFWKGTVLLARLGPVGLILLGAAAGVLRWWMTGQTTDILVLSVAQGLHALTFGAAHLGGMAFISRAAPAELQATGQSLYSAISMGAAYALALPFTGQVYAELGGPRTFDIMAVLALGSVGLAFLLRRQWDGQRVSV